MYFSIQEVHSKDLQTFVWEALQLVFHLWVEKNLQPIDVQLPRAVLQRQVLQECSSKEYKKNHIPNDQWVHPCLKETSGVWAEPLEVVPFPLVSLGV